MKTKCLHCGDVYSITNDPNPNQGFFIPLDALDLHDGEELARWKMQEIGAKPAAQCPACGMITPDSLQNDDVVAPAGSSSDSRKDVIAGCHSRLDREKRSRMRMVPETQHRLG